MNLRPRPSSLLLGILLVTILTLYFAHPLLLGAVGDYLVVQDALQPADAIIVLGPDRTGERVEHAVELFRQGLGKRLIISGRDIRWRTNSANIMKQHALVLGISKEAILVDKNGALPKDQAENVQKLMAQARLTSAILVTSPDHSARAINVFRSVLAPSGTTVMSSPSPSNVFDPSAWWKSRKGAKTLFTAYWHWVWDCCDE